ncbi:MAG TPA: hypothetical protein VLF63_01350 [Patescibacteria group bacterium]|nr:hypothetical protein [Patescibacteria group bacterium]
MISNYKSQTSCSPLDKQLLIVISLMTVVSLLFVYFHPYMKNVSIPSKTSKSVISNETKLIAQTSGNTLPTIQSIIVQNNSTNFTLSLNTSLQQEPNSSKTSTFDLQSSKIDQDPDSLNISIQKVQTQNIKGVKVESKR